MLEREINALTLEVQKGQHDGRRLRNALREAEEQLSAEVGKFASLKNELEGLEVGVVDSVYCRSRPYSP
ncbi:unnamed protein product [Dibothriocephalus latus]|uniref:Uncharacterized protein n=1 Tax=Dibothriocephalus latus TaxID=60516 RepID=A0A3P7LUC8_DIBLA|nr:unnamed protein product [Dibothriocephalus latus]